MFLFLLNAFVLLSSSACQLPLIVIGLEPHLWRLRSTASILSALVDAGA